MPRYIKNRSRKLIKINKKYTRKYKATGGGMLSVAKNSLDDMTEYAVNKLKLTPLLKNQSAGMGMPEMGAPPGAQPTPGAPGAPPAPGAPGAPPAKETELKKIKKQLAKSNKQNKKLTRKVKNLQLDNNELRKKLISVSEDIVKLQDVLPNVSDQVRKLIETINLYKVHKIEDENDPNKHSIDPTGPYFNKNLKKKTITDYDAHLKKVSQKPKKKESTSNNSGLGESISNPNETKVPT